MARLGNIVLALRVATVLLALSELGILVYVVYYADDYFYEDPYGDWGVNHNTPGRVGFLLFDSIWSLLALIYLSLAPKYLITGGENERRISRNARHRYAITALDTVTTFLWLAGWIAVAELIGGPTTCTNFCAAIQAGVAFAAVLWATFGATALIEIWQLWRRSQDATQKATNHQDENGTQIGMS